MTPRRHREHRQPDLLGRVGRSQRGHLRHLRHHGGVPRRQRRGPGRLPDRRGVRPRATAAASAAWTTRSPTASRPTAGRANTKNLDVHYSSGVGNHFFYLLAEGSGSKTFGGVAHSSTTCNGSTVTGIGRDAAAAHLVPCAGRLHDLGHDLRPGPHRDDQRGRATSTAPAAPRRRPSPLPGARCRCPEPATCRRPPVGGGRRHAGIRRPRLSRRSRAAVAGGTDDHDQERAPAATSSTTAAPSPATRASRTSRWPVAHHLHRDQRGQQGHRHQVGRPRAPRAARAPGRHREPGELEQVAPDAADQHRHPQPLIGHRARRSRPRPAGRRRRRPGRGRPPRVSGHQPERHRSGQHRHDPVRGSASRGHSRARKAAPDGRVEPVGARVAEHGARRRHRAG